uniref:Uncharacterized protein n=1 Tax=Myoviridae sp. ctxym25 TaxID=2825210 RepID=A0A8S5QIF6_9CAUD|nr:MAG TPA: hypothetical protein [Myoviridae sp. ctxym25]
MSSQWKSYNSQRKLNRCIFFYKNCTIRKVGSSCFNRFPFYKTFFFAHIFIVIS